MRPTVAATADRAVTRASSPGAASRPPPVTHAVGRSLATRAMHLALLLIVLHQLIGSTFMEPPFPGDPPAGLYALHEYAGLAGTGVVAAFWIWALIRRGETRLRRLLPWFSRSGIGDVLADLVGQARRLFRGHLPDAHDGALASAVHGLGLLAVSAMAVTGSVVFATAGSWLAHTALDLHRTLANLVWAYLVGHAGLAVLHHLLGSDILAQMFWRRQPHLHAQPRSGEPV